MSDIRIHVCPLCNRRMRVRSSGRWIPHNVKADARGKPCPNSNEPSEHKDSRRPGSDQRGRYGGPRGDGGYKL